MVFSTMTFLFFFFPLVFILYYLIPNRNYKNIILLIFSILFYSWGEPKFALLMLATSFVAYIGGLLIYLFDKKQKPVAKRIVFITTVALLLSNLFIFKYLIFVTDNLAKLFGMPMMIKQLALPIGISFYNS